MSIANSRFHRPALRSLLLATAVSATLCAGSTLSGCTNIKNQPLQLTDQSHRSEQEQARDRFRHPLQTLAFFEVEPADHIVEIWPGGGWYTQILAPLLKDEGRLIAAHWPKDSKVGFFRRSRQNFDQKFVKNKKLYGDIRITELEPPEHLKLAENNTVDKILTFRNVHNWMRNNQEQAVFNAAFKALKTGGILGVVEHRAPEVFSKEEMIKSGYVTESYVKQLAIKAGFEFISASEINANPRDNKIHPKGVWTLPPSLRLKDTDKEKYLAIGESDRMTLKFRKPE